MRKLIVTVLLTSGIAASPMLMPGTFTGSADAAQGITLRARTAGDLAELCGANPKEPAADAKLNYCDGFAQAAVDLELQHTGDRKPFCFPTPTPSRRATLAEFVNWVHALPEHRELRATDGLFKFLAERFPCNK